MDRRKFLFGCAGMALSGFANSANQPNPYALVYLRRGRDQGLIDLDTDVGYQSFRYALRDVKSGTVGNPPRELGYLLSWMQTCLRGWGYEAPIVVSSGLRVRATNASIEGAARDSKHIPDEYGVFTAADIEIPGIPGEYVGRLAALAKLGGVGFYDGDGHTHVDIGRVRYWRKSAAPTSR